MTDRVDFWKVPAMTKWVTFCGCWVWAASVLPAGAAAATLEASVSYESASFDPDRAMMRVGRDGMVYMTTFLQHRPCYVLRLAPDGSRRGGAMVDHSAQAAVANRDGTVFVAHRAWNAAFVTILDRTFRRTVRQAMPVGDSEGVEVGQSGDFYVLLGKQVVRVASDGHVVRKYDNPVRRDQHQGYRFRVCEKLGIFVILGADRRLHCVDFSGDRRLSLPTKLGGGNMAWGGDVGGFDVDEDGRLYVLERSARSVRVLAIERDKLDGGLLVKDSSLRLGGLRRLAGGKIENIGVRVCGGLLLVRQHRSGELFRRYDRKTGRSLGAVLPRRARLRVTFPRDVWTAGEAVPFEVALEKGELRMAPRWRVWARPLGGLAYRELAREGGLLRVPAEAGGLYHVKVSAEPDPTERWAGPELAANGIVEVRSPGADGTATVFTRGNRLFFGRGEAIPFSLSVRSKAAGARDVTVELRDASRAICRWSASAAPGTLVRRLVPSAVTRALRPGRYVLRPAGKGLTPSPQPLVLGPGMREPAVRTIVYGDYGSCFRKAPSGLWGIGEACALQMHWMRRVGFNLLFDRWGYPSAEAHLALPDWQKKAAEGLARRLAGDPAGTAPEKARFGAFLTELLGANSAYGIGQMAILMGMDAGIPLGSGYDKRRGEEYLAAVTGVTEALKDYPAFRGWVWGSNWWMFGHRGAAAGRTPEEKKAYTAAMKRARKTGAWEKVLEDVCTHRLKLQLDSWSLLNARLKEIAPRLVTCTSGPYRNVECYPPVTFSNVDEVDLQGQFEQMSIPYHVPHGIDYYRRPGKPAWSHPELGNEAGTGDHCLPWLFQAIMRGAEGVGSAGTIPNWGYTPVEPREGRGGWLSGYRRLNDFLRRYGPWLATLEARDPVAIVASSRMVRTDRWHHVTGLHFARVFEAYIACLHAHRPAGIVFTEDLEPGVLERFQAVLLVDQWIEMEPKLARALHAAKAAGVKVLYDASCREELVRGFTPLGFSFSNLEEDISPAGDDAAFWRFPRYARKNLAALRRALGAAVPPVAETDNDEVFFTERRGGQGRYLFAVNNTTPDVAPEYLYRVSLYTANRLPVRAPLRLRQAGGAVYDVFALRRVSPRDGVVQADCRSIPARIFAILPAAIERVELAGPAAVRAGQPLAWRVRVRDGRGKVLAASVPVSVRLVAADGTVVAEQHAAAGSKGAGGTIRVPLNVPPGALRLEAAELFSGKGARLTVKASPTALPIRAAVDDAPAPATASGTAHDGGVACVERGFSPHVRDVAIADGGKLAVMNAFNWDHNVYGLDTETGAVRFRRRVGHYFAFSPTALAKGFCVQGYDLARPEGYHVYLAGPDGKPVRRFAAYGLPGRLPHRFLPTAWHYDTNNSFAVPSGGSWVAVAGDLGLAVWSRAGRLLWKRDWPKRRRRVRLSAPDDWTLLAIEGGGVSVHDARDGKVTGRIPVAPAGELTRVRLSADGRSWALYGTSDDGRVYVLADRRPVATFPTPASEIELSADGKHVVVTHRQSLKVYSVQDGLRWTFSADEHLRNPRISPDGGRIAVASDLGTLYVFSTGGEKLLARDVGTLCVPAWLPAGDLLVAPWMGEVCRLGTDYREKWRVRLQPAENDMRGKVLARDETPTCRVEGWGNAEAAPAPLRPNLLAQGPFAITFQRAKGGGGPAARLLHDTALLYDGKAQPPPTAWIDFSPLNYASSRHEPNYLVLEARGKAVRVAGITLVEDPGHPPSWLRDVGLQWWDLAKGIWVVAGGLLSDAPVHTHRLTPAITTTKLRLALPAGQNLRLAEIVLHAEAPGNGGSRKAAGQKRNVRAGKVLP